MSDIKHVVKYIKNNNELHDLITHLPDFKEACENMIDAVHHPDDKLYWERQVNVINNLIEITKE